MKFQSKERMDSRVFFRSPARAAMLAVGAEDGPLEKREFSAVVGKSVGDLSSEKRECVGGSE